MIGSIVPRPIAFVSTRSPTGIGNLAPYSFFNGVSSNPPCLVIAIGPKADGSKKDTLINIEASKEFVVNIASEEIAEPLVHCAATYPYGVDEMEKVGLTPLSATQVAASRVAECALHLECSLYNLIPIGDGGPGSTNLVIGRIEVLHVADEVFTNGRIDPNALRPLARLGGISYASLGDIIEIPVPDVG
jgi:flavin reductase (DIM6/NTAB) family NADH-FMN oxidoreductase RutF